MEKVTIAQQRLFHIIACCDKSATKKEIEEYVNTAVPTGITSKWQIPEEKEIQGITFPGKCDDDPERLHYYLTC